MLHFFRSKTRFAVNGFLKKIFFAKFLDLTHNKTRNL